MIFRVCVAPLCGFERCKPKQVLCMVSSSKNTFFLANGQTSSSGDREFACSLKTALRSMRERYADNKVTMVKLAPVCLWFLANTVLGKKQLFSSSNARVCQSFRFCLVASWSVRTYQIREKKIVVGCSLH